MILVTGGAGFLGGHLCEALVRGGRSVVALDNFDPFYDTRLKRRSVRRAEAAAESGDGSYRLVEGDVRDAALLSELVEEATGVLHFAGLTRTRPSTERPSEYLEVNAGGTLAVLEAARRTDLGRVVVASSAAVYGGAESSASALAEDHPTTPRCPYGVSKLAAERYAVAYGGTYGVPTVCLRFFSVYGPRIPPSRAVGNFAARLFDGRPPEIAGDGSQTRDFVYVDDAVRASRAAIDADLGPGTVLNVGSGTETSVAELARRLRDRIDSSIGFSYTSRHGADADRTLTDLSRAERVLGYEPHVPLAEGIERFVGWYRNNRNWYDRIAAPAVKTSVQAVGTN
jgi:UDP-glucose 4-epimerase